MRTQTSSKGLSWLPQITIGRSSRCGLRILQLGQRKIDRRTALRILSTCSILAQAVAYSLDMKSIRDSRKICSVFGNTGTAMFCEIIASRPMTSRNLHIQRARTHIWSIPSSLEKSLGEILHQNRKVFQLPPTF